ncbi:unnamed protein product [Porites evermanni]|uniref:Uncharacterized protein n=1 Tax=Porites evermanni TaxID=104178 RepID=A0ABN8M9Y9_9CNID|nr:unnamed protein product [Porites evermanni]
MKRIVLVFLALIAVIYAEPDRHPYVQCKIDLYDCMNTPDKGTMECLKEYMTCMEQLIPTLPPMPPSVQCVKDLYECFTKNEVGNFACVKTFGSCLNQELPSYIQACNSEVQQCWNSVTGYMDRLKCCTSFAYCFLNGPTAAPSAAVFDAIEEEDQSNDLSDAAKCKGDFGKCLKEEKGKNPKICFKKLRDCMVALIPPYVQCVKDLYECFTKNEVGNFACVKTFGSCLNQELPSYIQACNGEVQQCWNSVTGYMDRFKCCTSFAYCFLNGPTAAPSATVFDAIEEEDQSNDLSDAAKCKGDFGKCLKEEKGKNPKICFKKLGDCMVALIPPYVIQCKDKAKQCYNNASGLKDKLTCGKEFAICISNGAPTLAPPTS